MREKLVGQLLESGTLFIVYNGEHVNFNDEIVNNGIYELELYAM